MSWPFDIDGCLQHLIASDPALGRLVRRIGPVTLTPRTDEPPLDALVRNIVYQQLSGKAASTIHARLLALTGHPLQPQRILDTHPDALRSAGLSRAKTTAIIDLAVHAAEGHIPDAADMSAMDNASIEACLTRVKGIGPWTVQMYLMFCLGRPDVFPASDLGIRKGMARLYGLDELPSPADATDASIPWKPYRTIASWYLWRSLDITADALPAAGT